MKFKFFVGDTRTQDELIEDVIVTMNRAIDNIDILNNNLIELTETISDYRLSLEKILNENLE